MTPPPLWNFSGNSSVLEGVGVPKSGYGGDKAVKLRASLLQGEYRRGALKVDRELGYEGGTGPTIRKLESFPPVLDLVFGAYGEVSDGVKKLLDQMVESCTISLGLRKGTPETFSHGVTTDHANYDNS